MRMAKLQFDVPGPPVPKARARTFVSKTGAMKTFTPERTASYERLVRDVAKLAVRRARWALRTTPVRLEVLVRRARAAGDATNFCKSIEDACNGVVWTDDELVRELEVSVVDGAAPGVTVTVWDLKEALE